MQIKGYKIVETLGKGGMATVYLAIQESFDREVALKIMSPALSSDPSFGERFLREAKIVSRLVHPNIVTVYDVGVDKDQHFLSMEYVHGNDLRQLQSRLSIAECVGVIKDVARALDFAGRKGYVHRDVKPENIMLHAEDGRAVLMDFGIAKMSDIQSGMTQTGATIGTPYYMSPEQARGKPVDARSDIYSLGVVFYWLLMGRVPYSADSAVAVGIKHLSAPIPELPQSIALFQEVLNRAMAKKPDQRFQSGRELFSALDALDSSLFAAAESSRQADISASADFSASDDEQTALHHSIADEITEPVPTIQSPAVNIQEDGFMSLTADDRVVQVHKVSEKKTPSRGGMYIAVLLIVAAGLWLSDDDRREQSLAQLSPVVEPARAWLSENFPQWVEPVDHDQAPPIAADNSAAPEISGGALPGQSAIKTDAIDMTAATAEGQEPGLENTQKDEAKGNDLVLAPELIDHSQALVKIDGLLPQLSENLSSAQEIADLYRSILAQSPDHTQALSGYNNLRIYHEQHLERALASGDISTARALLDSVIEVFAEDELSVQLQLLEGQLIEAENQLTLFEQAETFIADGALTTPAGANANEIYQGLLAEDPDNKKALAGVQKIVGLYRSYASSQLAKDQFKKAQANIEKGLKLAPADNALESLKAELAQAETRFAKIETLRLNVNEAVEAERFLPPAELNAYEFYKQLLVLAPEDTVALAGLAELEAIDFDRVQQTITAGDLDAAAVDLERSIERFPDSERGKNLSLSLELAVEEAIMAAIEATTPRIPQLRVSGSALEGVEQAQVLPLTLDRTLHIAFMYENFQTATAVIQAQLYDGARSVQIAQVPVIVQGEKGLSVFRIDRPVEGFAEGGYHLDLSLNGQRLVSLPFQVEK